MNRTICLGVLAILLIGCALQEEKKGYWSEEAYSATRVQEGVYKVTIREYPEQEAAEGDDITLTRCADAAIANGYNYFVFLDRRFVVIQCYKERPADTSRDIYDARQLCSQGEE
jgi:hypothetical protein